LEQLTQGALVIHHVVKAPDLGGEEAPVVHCHGSRIEHKTAPAGQLNNPGRRPTQHMSAWVKS